MASSLLKNLSRIGRPQSIVTWHQRRFLRTTFLVRNKDTEDMDQLQKNPYYSKYADKIAKLQK